MVGSAGPGAYDPAEVRLLSILHAVSFGLLLLRLIVGGILAAHGYPKLFGGPEKPVPPEAARYLGPGFVQAVQRGGVAAFAETLRGLEVPVAEVVAPVVAAVEFFGGLLVALGWFTRLAALLLVADMLVAISKVHWRDGLFSPGGHEFPLSLLGACLVLIFGGPGKVSVDGLGAALGVAPGANR